VSCVSCVSCVFNGACRVRCVLLVSCALCVRVVCALRVLCVCCVDGCAPYLARAARSRSSASQRILAPLAAVAPLWV
jgi:hypothetical protein